MERFEKLGTQIMHRSGGGMMDDDPFGATLGDRGKRKLVAGLLGQAFVSPTTRSAHNREGTDTSPTPDRRAASSTATTSSTCSTRRGSSKPEIDVLDEDAWPVI